MPMNYENLGVVTDLGRKLEIRQRHLDALAQAMSSGVREAHIDVHCEPVAEGKHEWVRVDMPKGMALTIAEALLRVEVLELKAKLADLGVEAPL
jgi:hypothetical protein